MAAIPIGWIKCKVVPRLSGESGTVAQRTGSRSRIRHHGRERRFRGPRTHMVARGKAGMARGPGKGCPKRLALDPRSRAGQWTSRDDVPSRIRGAWVPHGLHGSAYD